MRYFRNKHDNEIIAEKHSHYSNHYNILNKNRTVICQVPIADIEESKSWEEEIEGPIKVIPQEPQEPQTFTLTSEQMTKFEEWRQAKNKAIRASGNLPNNIYTFCFTPTGVGTCEVILCSDTTELDVTNYNW